MAVDLCGLKAKIVGTLLEEQYDLDEALPQSYSFWAGWNEALNRAIIIAFNIIERENKDGI